MLTRILTALPLIAGLLAALFWASEAVWMLLMWLVLILGGWEWARLRKLDNLPAFVYGLTLLGLSMFALESQWEVAAWTYLPVALFWLAAPFLLWRGVRFQQTPLVLALGALLLTGTCLAMISLRREDPLLLLAVMGLVVLADSGAYFAGRRFGKHKLAPAISPGKTWEGAIGAFIVVTLYAVLVWAYWAQARLGIGLPMLLGVAWLLLVLSILGDLFESWLKRLAGVKDSGSLLPGHGGVLDRIDSLTAVLPVAALLWMWGT
ncbi:MAG: phosphatidate cytidylyltransferase [Pseudomonadota bacterium]